MTTMCMWYEYLLPAPLMPDRYPHGIGTRDWLFYCKDPLYSYLMLAKIIYNHMSTTLGNL
jgi:hypothetical protein